MTNRRRFAGWFSRLCLVFAALLYFAGAAAGPWAHARAVGWSSVATFSDGEQDRGGPVSHSEIGCFVCQALGAVGLPVYASIPPLSIVDSSAPPIQAVRTFASAPSSAPNARAPPGI